MKNNISLTNYFLCRSLLLGGGLSIVFLESGKDTYLAVFLGIIIGLFIIFILSKLLSKINMPISEYLKQKTFLNIIFRIVYFLYLAFLIFILLITISTFIYSYFLPFTPSIISCLPLIFLACYLNTKSSKNITYIASVLIVISLVIVITKTLLLTNNFDFSNLLPLFSIKPQGLLKSAFTYAILTTAPFLTLLGEEITFKESAKTYLIGSLTVFIVLLTITLTMGDMINIYSYPEYSLLRKIRFFNFIENIENFISISWFFDIFISLSMASLKIKETLNTKKRFIPFIIVTLIMMGIHRMISDNFYNSMLVYKTFPYILAALVLIIFILLLIKCLTKKKQHQ